MTTRVALSGSAVIVHALPVTKQGEPAAAAAATASPDVPEPRPPDAPEPDAELATEPEPTESEPEPAHGGLVPAIRDLRDALAAVRYPLRLPSADEATAAATAIVRQIDDYLLPRLRMVDAPLLVVVGGSTGAGKSTLVNSLV